MADAVRSALAQGPAVREVIAVDDCSANRSTSKGSAKRRPPRWRKVGAYSRILLSGAMPNSAASGGRSAAPRARTSASLRG
ncbi:hypothetical protein ABIE67_004169 [Streptomyces sp. V4I8]